MAFPLVGDQLGLRKQRTFRDVTTAGFPLPGNDVRERAQKLKSIPGGTRSSFHYEGVQVQPYELKYLAQNSGFVQSLDFLKKSKALILSYPDTGVTFAR